MEDRKRTVGTAKVLLALLLLPPLGIYWVWRRTSWGESVKKKVVVAGAIWMVVAVVAATAERPRRAGPPTPPRPTTGVPAPVRSAGSAARSSEAAGSELEETVDTLYLIDSGRTSRDRFVALLQTIRGRFPKESYAGLADQATKAMMICATNGVEVRVVDALTAVKATTDGFSPREFKKIFGNNPPSEILVLWIAAGCR